MKQIIVCGNSSVGRAQPCQGWGREFESRFPLLISKHVFQIREDYSSHTYYNETFWRGGGIGRRASSSLVFRSFFERMLEWWNGRHEGLKILWAEMSVRVRVSLRAHYL